MNIRLEWHRWSAGQSVGFIPRLKARVFSLLFIIGSFDHLIPPEASKPFTDVIPSEDTDIYEFPTGHVGMAVSGKAHAELWPRVATWFRERSETQAVPPAHIDSEEDAAPTDEEQPLQTLNGIGPAYEKRLTDAGISTVNQLAGEEPTALADRLEIGEARVTSWIKQAKRHTD